MAQHKWHKEIKAWADGAEIEGRNGKLDEWSGIENPMWFDDWEYRIKPQPKEPKYLYVYKDYEQGKFHLSDTDPTTYYGVVTDIAKAPYHYVGKIKLEEGE